MNIQTTILLTLLLASAAFPQTPQTTMLCDPGWKAAAGGGCERITPTADSATTPTKTGGSQADATIPQTVDVKDRHGVTVLTISNITLFRRSAPVFRGVIKNVSGSDLWELYTITGTVHKRDGSVVQFTLRVCDDFPRFSKDVEHKVAYPFSKPWPFSAADFVSVEFSLPSSWQSPEDERINRTNDASFEQLVRDVERRNSDNCALLYKNTADKKVSDVTVKEQQDIQWCKSHSYW